MTDLITPFTVAEDDKETRLDARSHIELYEDELQKVCEEEYGDSYGEKDEINNDGLEEYFLDDGVYIRELFIPKDRVIVTKLWKRDRFWIIPYGEATFTSELGSQRIKGPHRQVAPYGTRVVLRTHEDTLWFAISATESPAPEIVEQDVFADTYEDCVYPWDQLEEKQ